jgi:hypothetical protein
MAAANRPPRAAGLRERPAPRTARAAKTAEPSAEPEVTTDGSTEAESPEAES